MTIHEARNKPKKNKKKNSRKGSSGADKRGNAKRTGAGEDEKNDATTMLEDQRARWDHLAEHGDDPDGSLHVARGMTREQAQKVSKALLQRQKQSDAAGAASVFQAHLWGGQTDLAKDRRALLREDDANPKDASRLNEKQRLALEKRRRKKDTKMAAVLERHETKRLVAAAAAADAVDILQTNRRGLLEAENDMERTTRMTQVELKRKHLNAATARQIYDLTLTESAPYSVEYDRSGRHAILCGAGAGRGHLAVMDCHQLSLRAEFFVDERVRCACFLHNYTLFAAAQKSCAYIYDDKGAEIHRLSEHCNPTALQFLPHHWLLASINNAGCIKYQDTSTGQLVSKHRTALGPSRVLRQNPTNAVLHAGHTNGTVTLWSPAQSKFLVKMLCHRGAAVSCLAVDPAGTTMVTGGADGRIKVWDLRMYKELHTYWTTDNGRSRGGGSGSGAGGGSFSLPTSMDISQTGILGVGHGCHAHFYRAEALQGKIDHPHYMHHYVPGCGPVERLRFRPFEDVVGIGHSRGVGSIVIPGCGEPALDTAEYHVNPFMDKKQRREQEVRSLLDKLHPDMIALDADCVGGIEASDPHLRLERVRDARQQQQQQREANEKGKKMEAQKNKKNGKKRGRSKIRTQLARKEKRVKDENTCKLRASREQQQQADGGADNQAAVAAAPRSEQGGGTRAAVPPETPKDAAIPAALKRFFS